MTAPPQDDSAARNRLLIIGLTRLSGVLFVALGVLVLNNVIELPDIAGYVLIVIGAVDTIVLPQLLAKRWRSDKE